MALDKMGNYIPDGTDTGQFQASGGMTGGYANTNVGKPTPTYNGLQSIGQPPAQTAPTSNVNYGVYGDLLKNAYGTLGREGDAAGIDQWTKYIQQLAMGGMSGDAINKHVMDAFASTPEAMAYSQSGKNPNQIQYGATLDPSRRSGGEIYWRDQGGDTGGQVQDIKPYSWNTEGLNFGATPEMGATPIIDPQTGKFMGWQGKTGAWTTKDQWTAMDTGLKGMSGGDAGLYNQLARPIQGQNGNWVMYDPKAREAPEAFQHGPNNFMERLASKSPYIIGAMALGGAGLAATGMTAAEASAAVSGGAAAGGGGAELGAGSTLLGDVTPAAGTVGYGATPGISATGALEGGAAGGTGALGGMGGAEPISTSGFTTAQGGVGSLGTAAETGGIGSGAATAGTASSASTMAQISDYVKKGMTVMQAIQKVLGGQAGGAAGGGTGGGAGGGGGGLMDLLGAYYSAQQQKDLAGNLKEPYSAMQGRQDPYNQLLLNSYQHPEQFYNSSTWNGLESVYQNSIDRGAAKGGTLANPTDRERLLQAYGIKELENYRNGLRGNVNAYDPTRLGEMYQKGLVAEAGANTAPFAAWAKAGGAQGVMNTVVNTASTASDIWKLIEGWFTDKP